MLHSVNLLVISIKPIYNGEKRSDTMKKLVYLGFVFFFTLVLVACGADSVLRVGMDLRWPPFETIDEARDPSGISVDLALELGLYLGREVEIVDLEFGSLIAALETNQIDVIIGSMSITATRQEKINFSDPYFYFPLITILNKTFYQANPVETKAELFALPGVRYVGPKSLVSLSIPREQAFEPVIIEVNDTNSAVLEIITGAADAYIISASTAAETVAANPDTTVLMWDPIDLSPIGMGVAKGNDELLTQINAFIAGLETNGVYDRLRTKYNAIIDAGLPGRTLDFYIYDEDDL
jgi:polar amino acid transport system substrate-binding protein